jgi:hypothetical protein
LTWKSRTLIGVWLSRGWLGVRVGRRYFKARDLRRHPLRYTERNRIGYRQLVVVGERWEFGVAADALESVQGARSLADPGAQP